MSTALIRLRGVHKRYGANHVLRGLDLDIAEHETVSVIGRSGSGKSTLLRLIMMLDRPDEGLLEIDGESPWETTRDDTRIAAGESHLRRVRSKVGMVFQHFNLFPHMSAIANVMEAPMRVLGLARDAAAERARDYLERVGLGDRLDALPATLSGGQKQRVAIARALAMQPRIMLFDEVTSALDPELVGGILALLRELASRRTMTMVIVTHHMRFAERVSDRVLFFDEGVIAEQGTPEAVFHHPRQEGTRRFVAALTELED